MNLRFLISLAACAALQVASAQSFQRRASLANAGVADHGQCVVELWVDGSADVEIRGDYGNLTNVSGQAPQWRRFDCTGRMPANPRNVHVRTQEGRGRVDIMQGSRPGADTIVQIADSESGGDRYVFTIDWSGDNGFPGREGSAERMRGPEIGSFPTTRAIDACEHEIRDQSIQQLNTADVVFDNVNMDTSGGPRGWVTGIFYLGRDRDRDHVYQFSCAYNADTGRVRSVRIDPSLTGSYSPDSYAGVANDSVQRCEDRVQSRLSRDGYAYIKFGYVNSNAGGWHNDRVSGTARAYRSGGFDAYQFSCSVDPRDGDVRSVNVTHR